MPAFHPLADIFPLMEGAEFDALVADIKERGLEEPIIVLDDQILDGRNRFRACQAANVEPIYQEWDNHSDPRSFVISKNLHRRHLNETQRAIIAAKIATRTRQETLVPGGPYHSGLDSANAPSSPSTAQAAEMLNVNPSMVKDAKTIVQRGTDEEVAAVMAGETALRTTANQIRKKVPPEQRKKKRGQPMSQTGKNPERIQKQQINAEIWGRVRDALTHLTSLPLASDVVAITRTNDKTGFVDSRLEKASQWLKDFSDAWHGQ